MSNLASMTFGHENIESISATVLPPLPRLLFLGVLLPAGVVGTNQLVIEAASSHRWLSSGVYPWMAMSTAALSWFVGRHLRPTWLCWIVFVWGLLLLDIQTITACLGGPVQREVGYAWVSSQISLVVLWAILGPSNWQGRMPTILVAAAAVIVFSGSFMGSYRGRHWNVLMVLTAVAVVMLCVLLRMSSFRLYASSEERSLADETGDLHVTQFGMRHLFLWSAAMVPLLFIAKGLDYLALAVLDVRNLFPVLVFTVVVATLSILTIWAVLGRAHVFARIAALVAATVSLAYGWQTLVIHLYPVNPGRFSSPFLFVFRSIDWTVWYGMTTALAAAMLLFLRARGYRLIRR